MYKIQLFLTARTSWSWKLGSTSICVTIQFTIQLCSIQLRNPPDYLSRVVPKGRFVTRQVSSRGAVFYFRSGSGSGRCYLSQVLPKGRSMTQAVSLRGAVLIGVAPSRVQPNQSAEPNQTKPKLTGMQAKAGARKVLEVLPNYL